MEPNGNIIAKPKTAMVNIFSSDKTKYKSRPTMHVPKLIATKVELVFSFSSSSNCPYLLNRKNKLLIGPIIQVENAKIASAIMSGVIKLANL